MDVIEVFNAKIADQSLNARAAGLAREFSLPGGAGSDAHDAPGVGAAYLDMPDFDGPASFLAALADARITGEFRDPPPATAPATQLSNPTRVALFLLLSPPAGRVSSRCSPTRPECH